MFTRFTIYWLKIAEEFSGVGSWSYSSLWSDAFTSKHSVAGRVVNHVTLKFINCKGFVE